MVPEAASPSGPPSSRMSRTSAPVAIVPERGAPRGQGSVPEEGSGSDQWAEPLQPKSSRGEEPGRKEEGGPGQVRVLPVSRHLGLPNSPICLLSPSTSAPGTLRTEHCSPPIPAKPRTETSGSAHQTRGRQEHFRSVLSGNGAVRQPSVKTTDRPELVTVLGSHQPAGVRAVPAFWHFLSTLLRCILGNGKKAQSFVILEVA